MINDFYGSKNASLTDEINEFRNYKQIKHKGKTLFWIDEANKSIAGILHFL